MYYSSPSFQEHSLSLFGSKFCYLYLFLCSYWQFIFVLAIHISNYNAFNCEIGFPSSLEPLTPANCQLVQTTKVTGNPPKVAMIKHRALKQPHRSRCVPPLSCCQNFGISWQSMDCCFVCQFRLTGTKPQFLFRIYPETWIYIYIYP